MRNAARLTTIPGYWDNDLTQVQIDYVPTAYDQTVSYWLDCVSETRSAVMEDMDDPIMIHSIVLAHLSSGLKRNLTLLQEVAGTGYAAKETLELLKSSGVLAEGRYGINAYLALFENPSA